MDTLLGPETTHTGRSLLGGRVVSVGPWIPCPGESFRVGGFQSASHYTAECPGFLFFGGFGGLGLVVVSGWVLVVV